jgi:hypothetical protein
MSMFSRRRESREQESIAIFPAKAPMKSKGHSPYTRQFSTS